MLTAGPAQSRPRGACVGKEAVGVHSVRMMSALMKLKLTAWPYPGAIGVDRVITLLPLSPDEDGRESRQNLAVAVFALPKMPAPPVLPPILGVQLEDADTGHDGVRASAVTTGSLADWSGLHADDSLLEVAGRPAVKAAAVSVFSRRPRLIPGAAVVDAVISR